MSLRILVTGADGFVGRALCPTLAAAGHTVRRAVRRLPAGGAAARPFDTVAVGDIGPDTDWSAALAGIEVIVHLAGRAHVMNEAPSHEAGSSDQPPGVPLPATHASGDPTIVPSRDLPGLARYRRVNVAGSLRLADAAVHAGVRRLVFASSIKVNGEATSGAAFRETDRPAPEDAYGISKAEAEVGLRTVGARTGLEIVVVRPPLVYGPGVKGNLERLMLACSRRLPLPLGGIDNRRSLVGLANLCSALRACAEHPAAAGQTFLVCDGEDVSTSRLAGTIARAMGRPAPLRIPAGALRSLLVLTGREAAAKRLFGSLQVDASHLRTLLGWQPVETFDEGMAAMVRAWLAARRERA